MKKLPLILIVTLFSNIVLTAQSVTEEVFRIFERKCISCHNNSNPRAGLDLEGSGNNFQSKMSTVYNNIVRVTPNNTFASAKGQAYIYPGRPDKSFIFRKVNRDLEPTISLHADEKAEMPLSGEELTNVEKEVIRQWILYGAPEDDSEVEAPGFSNTIQKITDYYSGNGMDSYPDGPPAAPPAAEGFQIKMGPFFIEPTGELELFQKYELDMAESIEVNRVDVAIAPFSHHFIIYDYNKREEANTVADGFRIETNHTLTSLVAALQEKTDLRLPNGTAFFWEKDIVLDLNTHYINYSATHTYKAEAYINIYNQEKGTAAQEMKAFLLPNVDIPIPNNGDEIKHTASFAFNIGKIFIWGVMGHTHQYGTGYKIYARNPNGTKGEFVYDAACPRGIPNCISPFFDYQHIPMRYFEPLREVDLGLGMIHEATWINDGPKPVGWGDTSKDEMMVMIAMYINDTTGVSVPVNNIVTSDGNVEVFPNPMTNSSSFVLPIDIESVDFRLFDMLGRQVRHQVDLPHRSFEIQKADLKSGMYLYQIKEKTGRSWTGKLMVE